MPTKEYIGAPVEFTGGPKNKLLRHRMERTDGSTILLLDFGAPETGGPGNGPLSPGDTFTPLIGPPAVVVNTNAAKISRSGGKLIAPASSAGATIQAVNVGSAGSFNLTSENPDFHAMAVFSLPNDAGGSGVANKSIWTLGGVADNMFNIDSGTNGRTPRVGVAMSAGAPAHRTITGFALGAVNVVSLTRVGTTAKVWLNGVEVASFTCGATLTSLSAAQMQLLASHAGQAVWAVLLERVPVNRTAQQAVADAYAAAVKIGYA